MRQSLLLIPLISLLVGCSKTVDYKSIQNRAGVFYEVNSTEPYSGSVLEQFDNGQNKLLGQFENGLMVGDWIYYYENGQVRGKGNYAGGDGSEISELSGLPRNGLDGLWESYYENGQIMFRGMFTNGQVFGKWSSFHENGQVQISGNIVDGKKHGELLMYYENGQMRSLWNYKDGKEHGEWIMYEEDGQILVERFFVDGVEQ